MNKYPCTRKAFPAILFLFAAASITLASCVARPNNVKLGKDDNGRLLELKAGDTLEISIPGNPTTGYEWEMQPYDDKILNQKAPEYKRDSDLIGAGGVYTFRFTAVSAGKTKVTIIYRRPWEKDVPPGEKFEISVAVVK